jgi:hypothetical protein
MIRALDGGLAGNQPLLARGPNGDRNPYQYMDRVIAVCLNFRRKVRRLSKNHKDGSNIQFNLRRQLTSMRNGVSRDGRHSAMSENDEIMTDF